MSEITVGPDAVRAMAVPILEAMGMPGADAAITADAMVWNEMRGAAGHGLNRLFQIRDRSEAGGLNLQVDWTPLRVARTALLFLPMQDEVNLNSLLEADVGPEFVATRTPREGGLTIHRLGGPLEVHPFGFLQPHATAPEVEAGEVDVFLVPGLAFDLFGNRLGRGAGYFDGLLGAARRGATIVGVVPTSLVVDELPREAHDIGVGYLATEEGVIAVAG